jgi:Protein of unknown function (DUF2931)
MNRRSPILLGVSSLFLSSCAVARGLPYDAWKLSFLATTNMEVWIETATVEDVRGRVFPQAGSGIASISYNQDSPGGWSTRIGNGSGRYVTGADLPKRIYVRWQSLVEPQTYRVTFETPESARQLMHQRDFQPRFPRDKSERSYRKSVVIGLAPGGIARLWISGPGLTPIPVLCAQAEVEPLGPYSGQSGGKHRPLSERALPYVRTHAIPYESWRCENLPNKGGS